MYFVDLEKIEDTKKTLKLRLSVEDYFERPPGEYSFWPLEGFEEENQDVHIHNETGESETITLKRLPEYRKGTLLITYHEEKTQLYTNI